MTPLSPNPLAPSSNLSLNPQRGYCRDGDQCQFLHEGGDGHGGGRGPSQSHKPAPCRHFQARSGPLLAAHPCGCLLALDTHTRTSVPAVFGVACFASHFKGDMCKLLGMGYLPTYANVPRVRTCAGRAGTTTEPAYDMCGLFQVESVLIVRISTLFSPSPFPPPVLGMCAQTRLHRLVGRPTLGSDSHAWFASNAWLVGKK